MLGAAGILMRVGTSVSQILEKIGRCKDISETLYQIQKPLSSERAESFPFRGPCLVITCDVQWDASRLDGPGGLWNEYSHIKGSEQCPLR